MEQEFRGVIKNEVGNWLCVSVSFNNLYGADTPGHS